MAVFVWGYSGVRSFFWKHSYVKIMRRSPIPRPSFGLSRNLGR